ncbi:MAG: DUF1638 domain-containing protein [Christensenella sp.]
MRLKMLACKALYREISLLSAHCENFVDVTYLRQGLHDTPALLTQALQKEIDSIDEGEDIHTYKSYFSQKDFDAILLGYGLCSNGTVGLTSKKYKLVVPRAHDCITLFLGSKEAYRDYFDSHSGTYWYNASWIENAGTPSEETDEDMLKVYAEKYGEENAAFLLNAELTGNYNRCAYVKWDELNFPKHEEYTQRAAKHYGWDYDCVLGNKSLMLDFLNGDWDESKFLTVPPGQKIAADYLDKDKILTCE